MATIRVDIPIKDEIGVIRFLIDEIEEERNYNQNYELAKKEAQEKARKEGGYYDDYMDYAIYHHEPRQSVIKDNIKTISSLCLCIGKEAPK